MPHHLCPGFVFLCAGLVLPLGGVRAQGPVAPAPSADVMRARQQIDSANALYIRAFGAADVNQVIALYDTAASELLPKGRSEHGHEALRTYWGKFIQTYGPLKLTLDVVEFWLAGDQAYETGKYTSIITGKLGQEDTYTGNYATVWRRQEDGGWKILAVFDTPK